MCKICVADLLLVRQLMVFAKHNLTYMNIAAETCTYVCVCFIHRILEDCEPYHSSIQPEQLWKYKYPHHENTVSTVLVLVRCFVSLNCLCHSFLA